MGNDLKRRLKMLEAETRNASPRLTLAEIDQAVDRYEGDRDVISIDTPTSSTFRTMLRAMKPAVGRLFLQAHPLDLLL